MTTIVDFAFSGCSSLESIEIPSRVTMIGAGAFADCSSLTSVTMLRTTPPALPQEDTSKVFESCKFVTLGLQGIQVPAGCADAYKAAWTNWKDYIKPDAYTGGGGNTGGESNTESGVNIGGGSNTNESGSEKEGTGQNQQTQASGRIETGKEQSLAAA